MATFSAIFTPRSGDDQTGTVGAGVSSAAITVGAREKIAINATGDINIAFGSSTMAAASASNFRIPSGVVAEYDSGPNTSIRIWNPGSGSITYWIQFLA